MKQPKDGDITIQGLQSQLQFNIDRRMALIEELEKLNAQLAEARALIKRHEDALGYVLYKDSIGFRVGWSESKLFEGDTPLAAIEAAKGETK